MSFVFNEFNQKKSLLKDLTEKLTLSQEAEEDDDLDFNFDDPDEDIATGNVENLEENANEGSNDETTNQDQESDENKPKEENEEELKEVDPLEEKEITGEETTVDENEEKKDDAIAVQPISNEPKPLIFLAGTCSGSDWRDPFMEKLKDAPFNPYIKDIEWTPQAAQNEVAMRNAAAKIVFGITPKQKGPLTIFELGVSIISSPDRTVVMIVDEDEGDTWEEHTKKAIDVIRASCVAQKVQVFDNPEQCIAFLNGEGESFDESLSPDESGSSTETTDSENTEEPETEENNAVEEENPPEEEESETETEEVNVSEEVPEESTEEGEEESSPAPDDI